MKTIERIIFDMDGTLYQIDGNATGYTGSTLEAAVNTNAKNWIMENEDCSPENAEKILSQALLYEGGMSWYFLDTYLVDREQYFNRTWDINPERIVQNYETATSVVNQLWMKSISLILLTAAPPVWQKKVLTFLGLLDRFDEIYTSNDFKDKSEIFEGLAERFPPEKSLSVGDQFESDIEPAQKLGYQVLKVDSPTDVKKVLKIIEEI